ncbi:Mur ligase family protein [Bacillus taeanensis]|uniref:UDP-N-acetylmuramoyl-tripeptide--D-alanyl-D-alanine ligase n=1 Tax=Bacillus taeanensis TaxID=273032 RepID=A0A366XWB3_9BACI|nr:Mur ligase family protein [Bacillus taeanensis]RBW69445.1 UDP-N-acetylmuramoyl-tripeptide--D-alanyl-D-alanine ligase [Bacillus taeanensis]
MKPLYLNELLRAVKGKVVKGEGNPLIKNVITKPYKIASHTMLFDLYKKVKIDWELFEKTQCAVVVTDKPEDFKRLGENVVLIKVDDLDQAYWDFIDYYRGLFNIPIIGVTGTCGKTTTKEMITHILEKRYAVQSTYKSFNGGHRNHRYLLGINEKTGAAVIEMGVDAPGDITFYINYFKPQIRILLNIDVYHLLGCKTPERYVNAKAEILHDVDPVNGKLIINADDKNIKKIDTSQFQHLITYIGFSDQCHFRADKVSYGKGGMTFTLHYQNKQYQVFVPGYGEHNVYNALAAIAACYYAGIDLKEACERITSFSQVIEHLEFRTGLNGSTVIDDTWNVTPLSMSTALEVMKEVAQTKTKIALLGYMPQLGNGEYAKQEYEKIGEKVIATNVDLLFVVGDEAKAIGEKALQLGMNRSKVFFCRTGLETYQHVKPFLTQDAIMLLKIPHRVMIEDSFKEFKQKIIV